MFSPNIIRNSDAHIVQLDRGEYNVPVLKKILSDKSIKKFFISQEQILLLLKSTFVDVKYRGYQASIKTCKIIYR